MDAQFERKLRELVDRNEIWRVLQKYGRGLDRLDSALARSCYWDDAIEDHGNDVGRPDAFIEWANQTTLAFQSSQHGLLNHSCDLQGDDAYCETYFLFSGVTGGPMNFMSTGRYIDHFQKRGGQWKIANRVCIIEGKFDVPASAMGAELLPAYTPEEPCQAARDRSDISYHRPPVPRRPRPPA
jgi:hypothetical protein